VLIREILRSLFLRELLTVVTLVDCSGLSFTESEQPKRKSALYVGKIRLLIN